MGGCSYCSRHPAGAKEPDNDRKNFVFSLSRLPTAADQEAFRNTPVDRDKKNKEEEKNRF